MELCIHVVQGTTLNCLDKYPVRILGSESSLIWGGHGFSPTRGFFIQSAVQG
jgi:hypothetical protein